MNNKLYTELQAYFNRLSDTYFKTGSYGNLPRKHRKEIRNEFIITIDKMLRL